MEQSKRFEALFLDQPMSECGVAAWAAMLQVLQGRIPATPRAIFVEIPNSDGGSKLATGRVVTERTQVSETVAATPCRPALDI